MQRLAGRKERAVRLWRFATKHLTAFAALAERACKVEFRLHYEFSSRLLETLVGRVFSHIANTMVEAFVKGRELTLGMIVDDAEGGKLRPMKSRLSAMQSRPSRSNQVPVPARARAASVSVGR